MTIGSRLFVVVAVCALGACGAKRALKDDGGAGAGGDAGGHGGGGAAGRGGAGGSIGGAGSTGAGGDGGAGGACFPLFHACTNNDECCAPYRCLNITGTPACQLEGPITGDAGATGAAGRGGAGGTAGATGAAGRGGAGGTGGASGATGRGGAGGTGGGSGATGRGGAGGTGGASSDGGPDEFCTGSAPRMVINGVTTTPTVIGQQLVLDCCEGAGFVVTTSDFSQPIAFFWEVQAGTGPYIPATIDLANVPSRWIVALQAGCLMTSGGCFGSRDNFTKGFTGELSVGRGDGSNGYDMSLCLHFVEPAGMPGIYVHTLDLYAPHVSSR